MSDIKIPIGTVGELKVLGIRVNGISDDAPADNLVGLDFETALQLAIRIMQKWGLPKEHQDLLLNTGDPKRIEDILVIYRDLKALYPRNEDLKTSWVTRRNQRYDNLTPTEYMLLNGTSEVRRNLDFLIFSGY